MVNQREDHLKRRKNGRESWEHAGAKWSVGYILHELGFKVFREPTLEVKGRSVRPDLIAIKGHAAIVVEIGQLQHRPIKFSAGATRETQNEAPRAWLSSGQIRKSTSARMVRLRISPCVWGLNLRDPH